MMYEVRVYVHFLILLGLPSDDAAIKSMSFNVDHLEAFAETKTRETETARKPMLSLHKVLLPCAPTPCLLNL